MNREIKFRVWNNVGLMSSPFTLQDLQQHKIEFTSECIVMQYTGLKDKNGKEVYEGDVIDCKITHDSASLPHRGEVVYSNELACFVTKNLSGCTPFLNHQVNTREVAGNIHEHKNLLL